MKTILLLITTLLFSTALFANNDFLTLKEQREQENRERYEWGSSDAIMSLTGPSIQPSSSNSTLRCLIADQIEEQVENINDVRIIEHKTKIIDIKRSEIVTRFRATIDEDEVVFRCYYKKNTLIDSFNHKFRKINSFALLNCASENGRYVLGKKTLRIEVGEVEKSGPIVVE